MKCLNQKLVIILMMTQKLCGAKLIKKEKIKDKQFLRNMELLYKTLNINWKVNYKKSVQNAQQCISETNSPTESSSDDTHMRIQLIATLWFRFGSVVWQQNLLWLPGQNIHVDTPLFLLNMQFYFLLPALLVLKSQKSMCTYIISHSSGDSMFAYGASIWSSNSQ